MRKTTLILLAMVLPLTACPAQEEATETQPAEETAAGTETAGEAEAADAAAAGEQAGSEEAAQAEEAKPNRIPAPEDVAEPPADAEKTESGLYTKVLQKGTGTEHPDANDIVTVHYTGWTTDGKMFDSSIVRGNPAKFPLNRVIAGWTEGLQLMTVGEKRRLWIPEELAYQGRPGAPAGMLVFDVELLDITKQPGDGSEAAAE